MRISTLVCPSPDNELSNKSRQRRFVLPLYILPFSVSAVLCGAVSSSHLALPFPALGEIRAALKKALK